MLPHIPPKSQTASPNASRPPAVGAESDREKPIIRLTDWGYAGFKTAAAGVALTRSPGERDDSWTDGGGVR